MRVPGVAAALLLALLPVRAARGDDLADARRKLASRDPADRLAALAALVAIDTGPAADALSDAIRRSSRAVDRLGERLDDNAEEWEKTFERYLRVERAGGVGTLPYRRLKLRLKQLEDEWDELNAEARLHLEVLREAGRALTRFRSPEAVAEIEEGARRHPHPLVRLLYVGGLAGRTRAESVRLLGELATEERDPRVRAAAVRALAPGEGAAFAVAACEDECWAVRRGAYEVLAHAPLRIAVPPLVRAAVRERGELQLTVFAYLEHLTRVSAASAEAWRAWWTRHAAAIEAGTWKPGPAPAPAPRERRTYATFFHIPVESANVAFAIDVSGSMLDDLRLDHPRADRVRKEFGLPATRLGYAKAELIAALRDLEEGARFNIVVYADGARLLYRRPKEATRRTRAHAIDWIADAGTGTMTNIWEALSVSFHDYLAVSGGATEFRFVPDTIVFLTDGNATRGRFRDAESLQALVDLWNRPLDTVIHCVGIGEDHDRKLLSALARETGGYYVDLGEALRDLQPRDRKPKAR